MHLNISSVGVPSVQRQCSTDATSKYIPNRACCATKLSPLEREEKDFKTVLQLNYQAEYFHKAVNRPGIGT